jgi:hypothetical protein
MGFRRKVDDPFGPMKFIGGHCKHLSDANPVGLALTGVDSKHMGLTTLHLKRDAFAHNSHAVDCVDDGVNIGF